MPFSLIICCSRTPRRAAASITLEASPVAPRREIPALAASLALVALGAGFGAFLRRGVFGVAAGVDAVDLLELLGGREFLLGLGLERDGTGDFAARAGGGKRGDVAHPTPAAFGDRPSSCRGGARD